MAGQHSSSQPLPSSSHRLPTVSAAEALRNLRSKGPKPISTGLPQLDRLLGPPGFASQSAHVHLEGLPRGQVTEVYGPPGVGKTTFGIQACANALEGGQAAVWVDCSTPLFPQRFNQILSARLKSGNGDETTLDAVQGRFHYYSSPTLAHLLALFVHAPPMFPPTGTGIIVIDSLSALVDLAYPRNVEDRTAGAKPEVAKWASQRRYAVLGDLVTALGKIAALYNLSVLVTSHAITRMRHGSSAILVPAIPGDTWDGGISNRLVLFRDWLATESHFSHTSPERLRRVRFAGVVKAGRVAAADGGGFGQVVPFTIEEDGLASLELTTVNIPVQHLTSPVRPPKRPYTEVADSDEDSDDLYDWAEGDNIAAEGLVINEAALSLPPTSDASTREPSKMARLDDACDDHSDDAPSANG